MKILIVYDSKFGNTAKVAQKIATTFSKPNQITVVQVDKFKPSQLQSAKLLIVGSPTHGGMPTQAIQSFLSSLSPDSLQNKRVAAFDTRISVDDVGFALKFVIKLTGYAAPRILNSLKAKGGDPANQADGFYVVDKAGPLKKGELARVVSWTKKI